MSNSFRKLGTLHPALSVALPAVVLSSVITLAAVKAFVPGGMAPAPVMPVPMPAPPTQGQEQAMSELSRYGQCLEKATPNNRAGSGCYYFMSAGQRFDIKPQPGNDHQESLRVAELAALRTPAKVREIQEEASVSLVMLFFRAAKIDPSKNLEMAQTISLAYEDASTMTLAIKAANERTRPSVANPSIQPVVPVPDHSSYPSGHATQSMFLAHLFSCWKPEATKTLMEYAQQIGRNREIAGVHYPSDTDAGFALGREMFQSLIKSKAPICPQSLPAKGKP